MIQFQDGSKLLDKVIGILKLSLPNPNVAKGVVINIKL